MFRRKGNSLIRPLCLAFFKIKLPTKGDYRPFFFLPLYFLRPGFPITEGYLWVDKKLNKRGKQKT